MHGTCTEGGASRLSDSATAADRRQPPRRARGGRGRHRFGPAGRARARGSDRALGLVARRPSSARVRNGPDGVALRSPALQQHPLPRSGRSFSASRFWPPTGRSAASSSPRSQTACSVSCAAVTEPCGRASSWSFVSFIFFWDMLLPIAGGRAVPRRGSTAAAFVAPDWVVDPRVHAPRARDGSLPTSCCAPRAHPRRGEGRAATPRSLVERAA